MSEQLKTPVPPNEFVDHDYSEVSAQTKRNRDFLDEIERKGGEIKSSLDAETGGLNALKIDADTTVTSSTQTSEANGISETTRPTLIAETEDMPGAERIEKKETSVALPSTIENN